MRLKVGLGRTGRMHAFEHAGIVPDVVTLGKSLGGGLPISAAVGPRHILGAEPASSLLTLAGNPVGAAAAVAVVTLLASTGLVADVAKKGQLFAARLEALQVHHGLVSSVRSLGLVGGIELRLDDGQPAADATARVLYRAWELGVTAISVGPERNVLELTPPLVITEAEMEKGFYCLEQALADVAAGSYGTTFKSLLVGAEFRIGRRRAKAPRDSCFLGSLSSPQSTAVVLVRHCATHLGTRRSNGSDATLAMSHSRTQPAVRPRPR